jgi:general secretion pathway protein G
VPLYQKSLIRAKECALRQNLSALRTVIGKIIMEEALTSVNQTEPGIFNVRSGSGKTALDGTLYWEW